MRVLLDTCVVSEIQRPNANESVIRHIAGVDPDDLFLSVITIGEVAKGIALLPHGRRKQGLDRWFLGLQQRFEQQILSVDQGIAVIWADISAQAQVRGIQIPVSDGLIAATAIRHGLQIMTRNIRDLEATGARLIDPWRQ